MRFRVVCGLEVTMAIFCPTSRFTSVDFPAFGRPTIATYPDLYPGRVGIASVTSVLFLSVIVISGTPHPCKHSQLQCNELVIPRPSTAAGAAEGLESEFCS